MSISSWITRPFRRQPTLAGLTPQRLPLHLLWRQVWSMANLDAAFDWLGAQTDDAGANSDVWDYRRHWEARRAALSGELQRETFRFQPARIVTIRTEAGDWERREVRAAEDRLVIRALAQVLQPTLGAVLSPRCTHLKGHGGLPGAVRETQDWLAAHPGQHVIKSDVQGFYAHIDPVILAEQLRYLLPHEPALHRLLWAFLRRTVEDGGRYSDCERGLPLGAALSPLLGAVYLSPLDALGAREGFYRRYMDDWVWVLPKRQGLRRALKDQSAVLQALRVTMHPDKTFIGPVARGSTFSGSTAGPPACGCRTPAGHGGMRSSRGFMSRVRRRNALRGIWPGGSGGRG
ncbi:reverse transcriptase domain-containing protein [Thiocystis minor]|uniref:reverse transcriptase domain-containing protein n=1 Tax=Thiocystis minor TaxID=61597 RepID=UPI00191312CF|nr:reverse transcriptase domain-containing protein [Thiocystis minor]